MIFFANPLYFALIVVFLQKKKNVDSQCYVDFAFEDVDVCDFVVVKESVGHPATFDFILVSILNNCLKVIIDGQYQHRGTRCIHSLHDHTTNFNIKLG